jgi:hypothetical protein
MNHKQQEILDDILNTIQKQFPEVHLINIDELNANTYWVTITEPSDEELELQMIELLGELSTDALLDYGFQFQFVPVSQKELVA